MKTKSVTAEQIEKGLRAAGYEAVALRPKVIKIDSGKRDKKGGVVAEPSVVVDVIAEPGRLLNEKTQNYMALTVAEKLGLEFRELQEFGGAAILRDCRLEGPTNHPDVASRAGAGTKGHEGKNGERAEGT